MNCSKITCITSKYIFQRKIVTQAIKITERKLCEEKSIKWKQCIKYKRYEVLMSLQYKKKRIQLRWYIILKKNYILRERDTGWLKYMNTINGYYMNPVQGKHQLNQSLSSFLFQSYP